jgi:ABC-type transport system involved in cytochrome c biogenesis permease subunit
MEGSTYWHMAWFQSGKNMRKQGLWCFILFWVVVGFFFFRTLKELGGWQSD